VEPFQKWGPASIARGARGVVADRRRINTGDQLAVSDDGK